MHENVNQYAGPQAGSLEQRETRWTQTSTTAKACLGNSN